MSSDNNYPTPGFDMLGEVVSKYTSPGAIGIPFRIVSTQLYLKVQSETHGPEHASNILNTWSRLMDIPAELIILDVVVCVRFNRPRSICAGSPKVDEAVFPAMDLVHPDEFWAEASAACGS